MKEKLEEAKKILQKLDSIKREEDQELQAWHQDLEEIKERIKGRYPELVKEYLAGLPNYETADIAITPRLPKRLFRLPSKASNITIEVRVAE